MKRFKIEQSTADIVSQSGLALIGQAISRYTTLAQELDTQAPLRHGIKHSDVVKSYLGLVSAGKNNFEAINTIENELFFTTSMRITDIPSEATLLGGLGETALPSAKPTAQPADPTIA